MLSFVTEPGLVLKETQKLMMPGRHEVRDEDVDLRRLGAVLYLAHEKGIRDFESLLLLEGVGPRTIQSLALVSEVIHGTPVRFRDPARFSFAHGGKDGHPFPVPLITYDETITQLQEAVRLAKVGVKDKDDALRNLSVAAQELEKDFLPSPEGIEKLVEQERKDSYKYGGRTAAGKSKPPQPAQLSLFIEKD